MPRIHLFEFEDQNWFPGFLRNYMTDFLQCLVNKSKLFKPAIPIIEKGLQKSTTNQLIDLASGGGGGLIWLTSELRKTNPFLKIILTDYFPNIAAFEYTKMQGNNFEYIDQPVDARNVPTNLTGLRTMFLSLHHFTHTDAKQILQHAVDTQNPIAILEAQERSIASLIAMFFSPLSVLLLTPFIRPFKFGRLIFTYLIPLVPIFVWWDGIVSSLRTYSVKEMHDLVNRLNNSETYAWEIGKIKSGPGAVLYLLGTKK